MEVKVREPTAGDVAYMAYFMRDEDAREAREVIGLPPREMLEESVKISEYVECAGFGGLPIVMWGVVTASMVPSAGLAWLIATPDVEQFPRKLLHYSRRYVTRVREGYGYLFNYVDERNELHLNWVRHMGFELGDPVPRGPNRRPCVPVSLGGY